MVEKVKLDVIWFSNSYMVAIKSFEVKKPVISMPMIKKTAIFYVFIIFLCLLKEKHMVLNFSTDTDDFSRQVFGPQGPLMK